MTVPPRMRPRVRFISSESIRNCPWCILMPDHYREDGTCRCDDPDHKEMAAWEYVWSEEHGMWKGHDDDAA